MQIERLRDLPVISIHAPREGSDVSFIVPGSSTLQFQSTLPVRGATGGVYDAIQSVEISIHAPREGSDLLLLCYY